MTDTPETPEPKDWKGRYWLPEIIELKMNALEAGALTSLIYEAIQSKRNFPINKPGPDGELVPSTVFDSIFEKLCSEVEVKCYGGKK